MATRLMRKRHIFKLFATTMLAGTACSHSSPTPPPRVPRVVLVHGIFESGKKFRTFKDHLEARGFEVYVPALDHPDGRGGLEKLAVGLKRDIDKKFGPKAPISIVGFSMGGIVSRQYLQHLGGAARCENFITISSPHHGTALALGLSDAGSRTNAPGQPVSSGTQALGGPTRQHAGDLPTARRWIWSSCHRRARCGSGRKICNTPSSCIR